MPKDNFSQNPDRSDDNDNFNKLDVPPMQENCEVYIGSAVPPECLGEPDITDGCRDGGCSESAGGGGLVLVNGDSRGVGGDYKQVNLADGTRTGSFRLASAGSPTGGVVLKYSTRNKQSGGGYSNFQMGLGIGLTSSDLAYIRELANDVVLVQFSTGRDGKLFWFEKQTDGSYLPLHGATESLVKTSTDYILKELDGTKSYFKTDKRWIYKQVSSDGRQTDWILDANDRLEEVRQSWTEGSQLIQNSRLYSYQASSGGGPGGPGGAPGGPGGPLGMLSSSSNLVQYITERSSVAATGVTSWVDKSRTELVIADTAIADRANVGDLTKIIQQIPDGLGGWIDVATRLFVYYTASSSIGFVHALKYEIDPKGYESLANWLTATSAQLLAASTNYYEYNSDRKITKIKTKGGAEYSTIVYSANSNNPTGANDWATKAVMTNNDGSSRTAYFNPKNSDLAIIDTDGNGNYWRMANEFDTTTFCPLQTGFPAAFDTSGTVFDESHDDLNIQHHSGQGRIDSLVYDGSSNRVSEKRTQQGSSGTPVKKSKTEYISRTVGSGDEAVTAHFVSKSIQYRSDSGTGDPVETTYAYTWHSGSLQPASITTTLPNVAAANNGVGFPQNNTTVVNYDAYGRMTQQTDAMGVVTKYEHDLATGAVTKTTRDHGTGKLNLIDESEVNVRGRVTKTLGPVQDGIRIVNWFVKISEHETWSASGYRDVSTGNETLVNPVSIEKKSADGTTADRITATRGSSVESAGALTSSDSFSQSSYTAWTRQTYDVSGRMQSSRVYHLIPSSGLGSVGTNYVESTYDYDDMGRQNKSVAPDGTIQRTVFDARGLVVSNWVGTDDTSATQSDPSGGGASGNNMVMTTAIEYDDDSDGGQGQQTKVTQKVDASASNDRVTEFEYNWQGQLINTITSDGVNEFHQKPTFDNQGRTTVNETFRNDSGTLVLIAKSESFYDERGRSFRSKTYAVSDSGVAGNSLQLDQWFDANGRTIKSSSPGSQAFTKTVYDALGRTTKTYQAYFDGVGSDDPQSVSANVVLTQSETQYNDLGQVLLSTSKDRLHDATGNGPLNGPGGVQPKSRDSYAAMWYDKIGRSTAQANYGTNAGSAPTRPATAPASSDTVLVSKSEYDISGRMFETVDPAGRKTRSEFDDAGRTTKVIQNFGGSDTQTVRTQYNSVGQMSKQIAENADTGDQETVHTYGVTLANSDLASNAMLRQVTHADGGTTVYAYDRTGQQTHMTDPNNSIHAYDYDAAGRRVSDTAATLGSGVDGAVRRIEQSYDDRGRLEKVTSFDSVTGGSVESEIQYEYNDFGQMVTEYQQHGSAVNVASSPSVEYSYEDGSANTIRMSGMVYPDGRELDFGFGTSGSQSDLLDRVVTIESRMGSQPVELIATYQHSGSGSLVSQTYNQPGISKTLHLGSGSDPYAALDRFGRMIDLRWTKSSTDLVGFEYGYDRVGNRLFERNTVSTGSNPDVDSLFDFDELNRMTDFDSGLLNTGGDSISSTQLTQSFTLDETGNYTDFVSGKALAAGSPPTTTLNQSRSHNKANETTNITETVGSAWATPAHDAAGNMTAIPQPNDLAADYDATWDAWNRLVKLADGSTTVAGYEYDGANRRIIVKAYDAGSLDETRHVYYSAQSQAIEERADSSTDAEIQFVWNLGYVDDLILRDRDTNASGTMDERLYSLPDLRFSVMALANAAGTILERYAYDAIGASSALTPGFASRASSSYDWEFRYTGRREDLDTGLMFFRARYYHPDLGRFISRDPLGFVDGMSQYRAYFVPGTADPTGKKFVKTGIKFCDSGGLVNHAYVKTRRGKGYGYYAESHLQAATLWDDVCTFGVVRGVVKDNDEKSYPGAYCSDVLINDNCWDAKCYARHVEAMLAFHYRDNENFNGYNVLVRNCNHWAREVIFGKGINSFEQCEKKCRPWNCSFQVILKIEGDPTLS